jgi:hypothetical protein
MGATVQSRVWQLDKSAGKRRLIRRTRQGSCVRSPIPQKRNYACGRWKKVRGQALREGFGLGGVRSDDGMGVGFVLTNLYGRVGDVLCGGSSQVVLGR